MRSLVEKVVGALAPLQNNINADQSHLIQKGRALLRKEGFEPNPVGAGNKKTGLPGTYRPVGASCPSSCALLGAGCYAQKGNVALAQKRAEVELTRDLSSAALGMAVAKHTQAGPCRLHVSGDLLRDGSADREYMAGLADIAKQIDNPSGTSAYGYTHAGEDTISEAELWHLASVGIRIRRSLDKAEDMDENTAIVAERNFANFGEIKGIAKRKGLKVAKCREQLDGTSCAECKLCWEKPEVVITFAKH